MPSITSMIITTCMVFVVCLFIIYCMKSYNWRTYSIFYSTSQPLSTIVLYLVHTSIFSYNNKRFCRHPWSNDKPSDKHTISWNRSPVLVALLIRQNTAQSGKTSGDVSPPGIIWDDIKKKSKYQTVRVALHSRPLWLLSSHFLYRRIRSSPQMD